MIKMFEEINKKYNTVVIDPPWDLNLVGGFDKRENRAEELPYKTMTLQEIKDFPIKDFANQGAHIYLWTTNSFLRRAFEVFDNWGVNFHLILVYAKPSFIAPVLAYQFATEFCLLGFFGKPMQKFSGKIKLNWFKGHSQAGSHSKKPDEAYNLIRDMSPEPRIDIFSRRVIDGFDTWGDESPNESQNTLTEVSGNSSHT